MCRGGEEPQFGALMRFLGVLQMPSGWNVDAMHVPRVLNDVADGISWWDKPTTHSNPSHAPPRIPRQVRGLGGNGKIIVHIRVLASNSCETSLRRHLGALTKDIFFVGRVSPECDMRTGLFSPCKNPLANVFTIHRVRGVSSVN